MGGWVVLHLHNCVALFNQLLVTDYPFSQHFHQYFSLASTLVTGQSRKVTAFKLPIKFVGVWAKLSAMRNILDDMRAKSFDQHSFNRDMVASMGIIGSRALPFIDVNENIRVFRHAIALDEHCAKFRPKLCFRPSPGTSSEKIQALNTDDVVPSMPDSVLPGKKATDPKEVWFAGCHADIGGGNAPDTAEHALANISLRWMIEQIVGADRPILFDWDAFARWNIPTTIGHRTHQSSSSKDDSDALELELELRGGDVHRRQDAWDAVQPITDELKKFPVWWILVSRWGTLTRTRNVERPPPGDLSSAAGD
ncbi:hypothetical protein BC826DRAFT_968627 [Russula brevipes]|nr:hypothetical protein BC826DRAFT_968627 [Russula brevipes]